MTAAPRAGLRANAGHGHLVRYRGRTETPTQRLRPGQVRCPSCRRGVTPTTSGRLRMHRDLLGDPCFNYLAHPVRPLIVEPEQIQLPRSYNTGSEPCPGCRRLTPVLADGTYRRHRPVADTFAGPYCTAGAS